MPLSNRHKLLPAHSIHALEVEDVVRQAGVSRGTFYKYFPSIPGLYGALSRQLMLEVAAMMEDLVPHGVGCMLMKVIAQQMSHLSQRNCVFRRS